jgi:hypothetical protein
MKILLKNMLMKKTFQEDPHEAYHVEDSKEEFNEDEVISLNELDEDIQATIPPTHKE